MNGRAVGYLPSELSSSLAYMGLLVESWYEFQKSGEVALFAAQHCYALAEIPLCAPTSSLSSTSFSS